MNWFLLKDRVQGWLRWLQGEIAYYVQRGGNRLVNPLHLVITTQYAIGRLNAQVYELSVAHQRIRELEAEVAKLKEGAQ